MFAEVAPDLLIRWCQGLDLRTDFRDGEEPSAAILGMLPREETVRAEARRALALAAAHVLARRPDEVDIGRRPEMLLYNLLKLSAALDCRDVLWQPLYDAYLRQALRERVYLGIPLWDTLLDALARNQIDDRLEEVWRKILEKPAGVSRYTAFSGVIQIPRAEGRPRDAALDAIGHALRWMAIELDGDEHKRADFQALLRQAEAQSKVGRPFQRQILERADRCDWPKWSVEALLSLFFPISPERAIVWARLGQLAQTKYGLEVRRRLCHDVVWEVSGKEAVSFLVKVAPFVEDHRVKELRASNGAMIAVLNEGLMEAERSLPEYASALESVRDDLLHDKMSVARTLRL